mmetsp:Transcript_17323/g.60924  ORF Transcript_17323/g.60924 Transcript_17323/m.60924 type:complete len:218 (+) Transcript_17323:2017-2670(+)
MIGTTLKGTTHSSLTPNLARRPSFCWRSRSAAKSSGASDGTDVTTPVPLPIEMVRSGSVYTTSYVAFGAESGHPMRSWPVMVARHSTLPSSGVASWYERLRAARSEHTYTSSSFIWKAPYSPSGSTKQLVWPYIVSGRRVAATRKMLPAMPARHSGLGSTTRSLMSVYSCGPTPSPVARSWSAHAWPSSTEYTVGRLPKATLSLRLSVRNCQRMNES